jgi:hypothetical protein
VIHWRRIRNPPTKLQVDSLAEDDCGMGELGDARRAGGRFLQKSSD